MDIFNRGRLKYGERERRTERNRIHVENGMETREKGGERGGRMQMLYGEKRKERENR